MWPRRKMKYNKTENRAMVQVKWEDSAVSDATWVDLDHDEVLEPVACTSIGYLLHDSNRFITLAGCINKENKASEVNVIPRGCILDVKVLDTARKD